LFNFFQHEIRRINIGGNERLIAGGVYDARLCVHDSSGSLILAASTLNGAQTGEELLIS